MVLLLTKCMLIQLLTKRISARLFTRSFSVSAAMTSSIPQSPEVAVGISAVLRASLATDSIFKTIPSSLTKSDSSPVTLGDFAAQAIVNTLLGRYFPQDGIVAEEEAQALRQDADMRAKVGHLVRDALNRDESHLSDFNKLPGGQKWGKSDEEEEAWLQAIDLGAFQGGNQGRFWTLDPIDGTKGFLRGGQYAICLALIENGQPTLGIMACPNLPFNKSDPKPQEGDRSGVNGDGTLFLSVKGSGAWQVSENVYEVVE